MSQLEPSVLLETDPLLRQSIEAQSVHEFDIEIENKTRKWPKAFAAVAMGVSSIVATTIYEGIQDDTPVAEATFDNTIPAGQEVCAQVGNPGDILVANSTVTNATGPGFATVGPRGADPNAYSTNNYDDGAARPNLTMTKIGPDGNVCITPSQSSVHGLIDAIGFLPGETFESFGGRAYPTRVMDTRQAGAPIVPGQEVCAQVGNPGDILVANSTVTNATGPGFATVGPRGADPNAYSTNNYDDGAARPNLTMTKIGPDGNVCITPSQSSVHGLIDAIGFLPGETFESFGGRAYPTRVMDTRTRTEPGVPVVVGAIGGVSVTGVCNNSDGNDYVNILNTSNEQITAVVNPSADAQFESFTYSVPIPPGGFNSGFGLRNAGKTPSVTVQNRAGQVSVDLSPCGERPPIVTPIVSGAIEDVYISRSCRGPDSGNTTFYTEDYSPLIHTMNLDIGNDGTVDLSPGLAAGQPKYITQSFYGDYHSATVDGKVGKVVIDYSPCKILPPEHNGNLTRFPL